MTKPTNQRTAARAILLAATLALATATVGWTQTISYVYVAPSADIDANFTSGVISGGDIPGGYKGVPITSANESTFESNGPARVVHLYRQMQPGTTLRNRVDQVFQISGGMVDVTMFLVDDRTGIPEDDTGAMTPFDHNDQKHVWPAASVSPRGGGSDRYDGKIAMGQVAADVIVGDADGEILAWEATALHELSHTQFVGPWTKWGAINQRAITYGADSDHYKEELLGDQAAALDEGHGTFYGDLHNEAERRELLEWFTDTDYRYFVEAQSVLAGSRDLYSVEERRAGTVGEANTRVWDYRWRDVPGFYLLFSESTANAFYDLFWMYADEDQDRSFQRIIRTSHDMWQSRRKRFLTFACNRLALQMEAGEGGAGDSGGRPTSSMFPFALLDVLTHFGMTQEKYQEDYRRHYPDSHPRAYEEYWNHREAIQRLVNDDLTADPIRIIAAVEAVRDYLRDPSRQLGGDGSEAAEDSDRLDGSDDVNETRETDEAATEQSDGDGGAGL